MKRPRPRSMVKNALEVKPEAPPKMTVEQYIERRLADIAGYFTGALEQLMFQQGQEMTTQAGIIQYLDEQLAPGAAAAIKSVVAQNISRMKAEREARQKAADEADAKKATDVAARVDPCECCGAPGNTGSMPYGIYCDPCGNNIAHPTGYGFCFVADGREHRNARPADWVAPPEDAADRDTSGEPYDPTNPINIARHAEARRNRTGCYAPGASDDPDKETPADIAPTDPPTGAEVQ